MTHQSRQRYALALLLLSLHGVLVWGFGSPLTQTLLLVHYGLFLLWQPVWHGEQKLTATSSALFILGGMLLVLMVNWWVLAFWMAGVFGLLGGRVFGARAGFARTSYLLAAAYLLGMLLLSVVPRLLGKLPDLDSIQTLTRYLLPLLPASLLFLPDGHEDEGEAPVLDLFYSLLLFLLTVILVLGGFALQVSTDRDYLHTLIRLLFGVAAALVLLSWLWNPRAGFTGIGQLLSRYLLTIGMPFEHWLKRIAELASLESTTTSFIRAAMREVAALPWVSGGSWKTDEEQGEFGRPAAHQASFDFHDFRLTLHTRWPLTPALLLHIRLLTLILGEFFEAKRREKTLSEQTYMRAVYETGSRMTHDIKNLVQSLSTLCVAAQQAGERDGERLMALIQRQLPQLSRRLELTLDKLQAPQVESTHLVKAASWWSALQQRHADSAIVFRAHDLPPEMMVDATMMDNVADNLLQNALKKSREAGGELQITVTLQGGNGLLLDVRDSGNAIPPEIARQLFKTHLASESGMGIGLYHAARMAGQAGYDLALNRNEDGAVCFTLSSRVKQERRRYARTASPIPD